MEWLALFLILLVSDAPSANPILSELFANPRAWEDREGEFLELGNPSGDTLLLGSFSLAVDGDTLGPFALRLPPFGLGLICRDSLAMHLAGVNCLKQWPGMSLVNSRPLTVVLITADAIDSFEVAAAAEGKSWENTWNGTQGYRGFALSSTPWLGDFASPGAWNGSALEGPPLNLALDTAWFTDSGLNYRVRNTGRQRHAPSVLQVVRDGNWDGKEDYPPALVGLPSLEAGAVYEGLYALDPPDGYWSLSLPPDAIPSDNQGSYLRYANPPLMLTEVCPAAPSPVPEWFEIRNLAERSLDLSRLRFEGLSLKAGIVLNPGEFLIVTSDTSAFRRAYGQLNLRLEQAPEWKVMRNSGDTLRLSLESIVLDSIVYGPLSGEEHCLSREEGMWTAHATNRIKSGSSPGYVLPVSVRPSLGLSKRILDPDDPSGVLELSVSVSLQTEFDLAMWDMSGNLTYRLCESCRGPSRLSWDGKASNGENVPAGPYVATLSVDGGETLRALVLVGRRK